MKKLTRSFRVRDWIALATLAGAVFVAQCSTPEASNDAHAKSASASGNNAASIAAWNVIYGVLQHPRCLNCHPAGDVPLQGEDSHAHAQNVQRGHDGAGLFAMRCSACHQTRNSDGEHLPPGAPGWRLPTANMPLVFEGRSPGDLCRQLKDRARNGGRSPEQLFEHIAKDPLVLWGWNPGLGRAPVSTSHDELVRAMRTWIDGGCDCPEK